MQRVVLDRRHELQHGRVGPRVDADHLSQVCGGIAFAVVVLHDVYERADDYRFYLHGYASLVQVLADPPGFNSRMSMWIRAIPHRGFSLYQPKPPMPKLGMLLSSIACMP